MTKFTVEKINDVLEQLQGIKIKEAVQLRKRLVKEKKKLKIKKPTVKISDPNKTRSLKLIRYWRYIKLIRDNFPDLTVKQIRKQLTQRQQGTKTEIPDAIWQNPSP